MVERDRPVRSRTVFSRMNRSGIRCRRASRSDGPCSDTRPTVARTGASFDFTGHLLKHRDEIRPLRRHSGHCPEHSATRAVVLRQFVTPLFVSCAPQPEWLLRSGFSPLDAGYQRRPAARTTSAATAPETRRSHEWSTVCRRARYSAPAAGRTLPHLEPRRSSRRGDIEPSVERGLIRRDEQEDRILRAPRHLRLDGEADHSSRRLTCAPWPWSAAVRRRASFRELSSTGPVLTAG